MSFEGIKKLKQSLLIVFFHLDLFLRNNFSKILKIKKTKEINPTALWLL